MTKRNWIVATGALLLVSAVAVYSRQHWNPGADSRFAMLQFMPPDASAVVYADVAQLRHSPFTAQLYKWAPQTPADPEYLQFLRETGFDYERDLDRLAVAVIKHGQETSVFAVADGRFDRKRIELYASISGTHENKDGREIFSVPLSGRSQKISFCFMQKDRIALTDAPSLNELIHQKKNADTAEWHQRFGRLAGAPIFALMRQDAGVGDALATQAPGGFQSPQLGVLLDQLQWISLAGKPEGESLRIVAEGETSSGTTARQLSDLLNGMLVLAQAGLNGLQTRQQLDPTAREAYLDLVRGADVTRIDRPETKSVRLVFDLTPKFLEAARLAPKTSGDSAVLPSASTSHQTNVPARRGKAHK